MPYQSMEGYVGLARQTASGTYQTPAKYLYVTSESLAPEGEPLIPDAEIGGSRDIGSSVQVGPIGFGGSLEFYLRPDSIGLLLYSLMGAVTSSGISGESGAYGHTFTPEDDCIPISVEKRVGSKADALEIIGYEDCKVNTFRIECAAGELATGSAEIVSKKATTGQTNQTATHESGPIFTFVNGLVNLEGVEIEVKSASFEITNNIDTDDYRIGQRTRETLQEKRRELSASIDIVPTDSTIFKKTYFDEATLAADDDDVYTGALFLRFESAEVIGTTAQKFSMEVNIPYAVFRSAPLPMSGDDMIVQTLELLPIVVSGDICTIVLRNDEDEY